METVKINIVPKGAVKAAHASQGDAPRVVRFELFDELLPYTLDGSEDITLKVVRPDTEEIVSPVTNTEEAYIDVSFTSEMTALRGVANCEIKISKNGAEIGSHNFDLNIERDAYGEDITVETAQGVIATFTTGVIDNLVGLKTTFEPNQDLHGFDTPWIDSNVVNKTPYFSRALSGTASRIGNYEFNKLVGGTYAFNQNIPIPPSSITNTLNDVTLTDNRDGSYTLSGTASADSIFTIVNQKSWSDHKYVLLGGAPAGSTTKYSLAMRGSGGDTFDFGNGAIWNASGNTWKGVVIYVKNGQDVNGLIFKPQLIDLTQLFGSTIADYIYSLETAQAGAGVAYFKNLFGADYYAYNAGELISVKPTAHITRDGNNTVISNTALDPDIELRGIPKLDENNKLYYDGDTYESNGDVTRRSRLFNCAVDTFGVTKNVSSDNTDWLYYFTRYDISDDAEPTDIISDTFETVNYVPTRQNGKLCCLNKQFHVIYINMYGLISTNDEETTKQWLIDNAVKFLYKKTPTTESADPFTDPQEIDAQGSEEFIDARAVSIPVGHESYYANICEIEGIDEITFNRTGVNLFDGNKVTTTHPSNWSVTFENDKLTIVHKTAYVSGAPIFNLDLPSGTYVISYTATQLYKVSLYINGVYNKLLNNGTTLTIENGNTYAITFTAEDNSTNVISNIQLEKGSQASEYQAYDGESALVEIGQEVYGGYYDKDLGIVLTDKLIDLGSLNYTYYPNTLRFAAKIDDGKPSGTAFGLDSAMSELYPISTAQYNAIPDKSISVGSNYFSGSTCAVVIHDENYTTVNDIKTLINGRMISYELLTPIIIPADAVNFETVKGVNNVWSDTNGETEVKFYVKEA